MGVDAVDLATLEAIVDTAAVAPVIEAAMPTGGRPRQLPVRTLLVGIAAAVADDRPAHLRRVHRALVGLDDSDQVRLGVVVEDRRGRRHTLTYRQVERTFTSVVATMASPPPDAAGDGHPGDRLGAFADALVEASVPPAHTHASTSVAVDWTDHETWARPTGGTAAAADLDAGWGHRSVNTPGTKDELFFGYYAQAVTMVADEGGAPVAEVVRRICMHPPAVDPVPAMAATLERMVRSGVAVGDVLADSGYAHRIAAHWAVPLRRLGARLVQDLHPGDRGPKGTFAGAIAADGSLWCPAIPASLLDMAPPARGASSSDVAAHDARFAEAAHYKLGRISADDADGYHRVACPATAGKLRCPLKADSMTLGHERPEVLEPPSHPPRCCAQASITVGPDVNAKTRQKHDYPGPVFRRSYRRRTAVERSFSTWKDPASTDVRRGWCRLMGRAKNLVMLTFATVVANLRVLAAFEARQRDDARRAAVGQPPRTRRRRRDPSSSTAA